MRKIITKCIMDMETLQWIEEEFYFYDGPIAECKGGGGGSSSGKVGFPTYMETLHSSWLDSTGTDTLVNSMADAMNAASGNSPWTTKIAYDPATDITAWETALTNFKALLTGISETTDWAALYTQADTSIDSVLETEIVQSAADYANQIDDDIEAKVLPRFRRGMQDINAVSSSAFVIGAALIESYRDRDIARHTSSLRVAIKDKKAGLIIAGTDQMLRLMSQKYGLEEAYAKAIVESNRIKIVAKGEQIATDAKFDEADAHWDLEVFQFGGNLLGAIGSGVLKPGKTGPSIAQSAIGGAMSGAAAGSLIAPGIGTAIGGVLGAASAFL